MAWGDDHGDGGAQTSLMIAMVVLMAMVQLHPYKHR